VREELKSKGGRRQSGARWGMDTLSLIRQWTMHGARRDLTGRFRPTDDIHAIIFGAEEKKPALARPLLMKRADEDDWRPLHSSEK
jgi:hypothetical protein